MEWYKIVLLICLYIIFQVVICAVIVCNTGGPLGQTEGVEFVNPVWWYRNYPVNPFGAIMGALGFTILCPIFALGYWFYKLCTVGRR